MPVIIFIDGKIFEQLFLFLLGLLKYRINKLFIFIGVYLSDLLCLLHRLCQKY